MALGPAAVKASELRIDWVPAGQEHRREAWKLPAEAAFTVGTAEYEARLLRLVTVPGQIVYR